METKTAMGLNSEHFKMVSQEARKTRIGFRVRDTKTGNYLRFYYKDGELLVDIRDKNDTKMTMPVVDVADAGKTDTYRDAMMNRIRAENPDKSDAQVEYEVDLLVEGRKTIEELVKKGVDPELAWKLVKSALNDRIASEQDVKDVINAERKEETPEPPENPPASPETAVADE